MWGRYGWRARGGRTEKLNWPCLATTLGYHHCTEFHVRVLTVMTFWSCRLLETKQSRYMADCKAKKIPAFEASSTFLGQTQVSRDWRPSSLSSLSLLFDVSDTATATTRWYFPQGLMTSESGTSLGPNESTRASQAVSIRQTERTSSRICLRVCSVQGVHTFCCSCFWRTLWTTKKSFLRCWTERWHQVSPYRWVLVAHQEVDSMHHWSHV